MTREAVDDDTPAALATSARVTLLVPTGLLSSRES
jgi:hypothetical protein